MNTPKNVKNIFPACINIAKSQASHCSRFRIENPFGNTMSTTCNSMVVEVINLVASMSPKRNLAHNLCGE